MERAHFAQIAGKRAAVGQRLVTHSVWLRNLSILQRNGLPTTFKTMVELGPADPLGIGLAALLSGVERYVALDVVRYARDAEDRRIFEELIALFKDRAPIPDDAEFPLVRPLLASYAFPADLLTSARLEVALHPARLEPVRSGIANPAPRPRGDGPVCYVAPWRPGVIESGAVDFVLSRSVLEHPPDLAGMYCEMCRWLEPGGIMSHEIDFKSIGMTVEWNGHWSCSDTLWRLAAGRRRHRLNREPHSTHVVLMQRMNCRVVSDECTVQPSAITRAQLAPHFRHLTDEDLTTSSALIRAVKLA
jgi:hypothetical protein